MIAIRTGRLVLGVFTAVVGAGVIVAEIADLDAWGAVPLAVVVTAIALIAALVARPRLEQVGAPPDTR